MKQIYAVKRKSGDSEIMTIQTGIDGLRLIADRTGNYAPGKEPTFTYNAEGRLKSSTAYLRKRTRDGVWHEVSATAFFDEYKPAHKSQFWDYKPHIMLAKCAEALALRKAFPAEMSGLYTSEEMEQANSEPTNLSVLEEEESEQTVEELQYQLQDTIDIPHAESFLFDYLKYLQSKLPAEKKLQDLMKEWLKDPAPFLGCYKNWLAKNKIDVFVGQKEADFASV